MVKTPKDLERAIFLAGEIQDLERKLLDGRLSKKTKDQFKRVIESKTKEIQDLGFL